MESRSLESRCPQQYWSYLSSISRGLFLQWEESVKLRLGSRVRLLFTCVCLCMCVHVHAHVFSCMWRFMADVRKHPPSSVYLIYGRYLCEIQNIYGKTSYLACSEDASLCLQSLEYRRHAQLTWDYAAPYSRPHICRTRVLVLGPSPPCTQFLLCTLLRPSLHSYALYIDFFKSMAKSELSSVHL